jgi:DNA-binding protein HU-beta
MTRAEFVQAVQVKMDLGENSLGKSKINAVLAAAGAVSRELLQDGQGADVVGLGTIKIVQRAARNGRNPRTGEPVKIPAKRVPKFVSAKALKDALKG